MKGQKRETEQQHMITIPITATYSVQNGVITEKNVEYATIPAQVLVDFLLSKFGIDPERFFTNE